MKFLDTNSEIFWYNPVLTLPVLLRKHDLGYEWLWKENYDVFIMTTPLDYGELYAFIL